MIIRNGPIVTWSDPNQILEDHEILVQDGVIKEIAAAGELSKQYPDEEVLDAQGQLIMPGNICAHNHFMARFHAEWLSRVNRPGIFRRSWQIYGGSWIRRWMKTACVIQP